MTCVSWWFPVNMFMLYKVISPKSPQWFVCDDGHTCLIQAPLVIPHLSVYKHGHQHLHGIAVRNILPIHLTVDSLQIESI